MENYVYQDNLESQRLITRKLTLDDIPVLTDFLSDEEVMAYLPTFGRKPGLETATFWVERQLSGYAEKRFGLQALIHKQTGDFIGMSGLLTQEVDETPEVEVAYFVKKKYWGQGYAPEAARLFIDYGFQNGLAESIISIIDVNNLKSQRVADKNGLIREKRTVWSGLDVYIYRIKNSPRWQ